MSFISDESRKFLLDFCNAHFCKDDPPIPPEVKSIEDYRVYLQYKELCLVDGEEPDPAFVDNASFYAGLIDVFFHQN
jgi:hypothetical protein